MAYGYITLIFENIIALKPAVYRGVLYVLVTESQLPLSLVYSTSISS